MSSSILVTGGAGFIGSNFVLGWLKHCPGNVVTFDILSYAGNLGNLESIDADPRHFFIRADINDEETVRKAIQQHQPSAIVHFAAESHVDRSILGPAEFIRTNIQGTFTLLQQALEYWRSLPEDRRSDFRFLHVSTDEVYGSLGPEDAAFSETTAYSPNSPYAASKAAADHLVRAYSHTYGLPTLTTNCSNNYGPYQFPEKLIPLVILNALKGESLPIYGDGRNVRDWLYVKDHCAAIRTVLAKGVVGETYNIGGCTERQNIQVVELVCDILDRLKPKSSGSYKSQIVFVKDRLGHDRRYAVNCTKIKEQLGWQPEESFESGMQKTVEWYLTNQEWVRRVQSGEYLTWIEKQYGAQQAHAADRQ